MESKLHCPRDIESALAAARWIGFSEEIIEALSAPNPALQPAIDLLVRLPEARALHAARGIPEAVTKATLLDMEVWLLDYREKNRTWGFAKAEWIDRHFKGQLYALGRLQFEMAQFHLPNVPDVLSTGDPVLSVHIPATGSLIDAACGESFRWALEFFSRHFPEHPFKAFICQSWMMDRQLERSLPSNSNLTCFVRRFHPIELAGASDEPMWDRVFGGRITNLSDAPRDTALRRAMLDHIATGGEWREAAGYILPKEITAVP